MDRAFDEILHEALALDRESKVELAERLAIDLSQDQEITMAWAKESQRRLEMIKRGEMKTSDAQESLARIRATVFKK
jgi:hypothetical protein